MAEGGKKCHSEHKCSDEKEGNLHIIKLLFYGTYQVVVIATLYVENFQL